MKESHLAFLVARLQLAYFPEGEVILEGGRGVPECAYIIKQGAVVVSARTGEGIEELLQRIDADLPTPEVQLTVLVPYSRGDLVDRIHRTAVIGSLEHTGEGTLITARVRPGLADELAEPEGFEVDASKARLTLKVDRPDGSSRDIAMGLELLERSRIPRSTGLFSADRSMPTQTLRLTPESVEQLRSVRQDLVKRERGGGATFGIQFGFLKRPPDARSAQFWVDLKLKADQDWFALFENATLQFGPRPSG